MTQEDVAKHLGVGKQAVYKYEAGTVTNIPLENIEIMAKIFNVSPCYLAGWSDGDDSTIVYSDDEQKLISVYRCLLPRGKELLHERAHELSVLYGAGEKSQNVPGENVD